MAKQASTINQQKAVASRATLIRLANSCTRLASRGNTKTPVPPDLDASDYQMIAEILRGMAAVIAES
jgi:hypothetical protein